MKKIALLLVILIGATVVVRPARAATNRPTLTYTFGTVGNANDLIVDNNVAYVAAGAGGLDVVDVSNPSSPQRLSSVNTPGDAKGITKSGNNVFVADGTGGLRIINVGSLNAPAELGSYTSATMTSYDVAVSGNYAYLLEQDSVGMSGMLVLNISSPASPTLTGSFSTTNRSNIVVSGSYVYIAGSLGLQIINISIPTAPTLTGTFTNPGGSIYGVTLSGNYAYLSDFVNGFTVVDISNPASPTKVKDFVNDGGGWFGITSFGNFALTSSSDGVSNNSLHLYDVSAVTSPVLVDAFSIVGTPNALAYSLGYVYVAANTEGLKIVNYIGAGVPIVSSVTKSGNRYTFTNGSVTYTIKPFSGKYKGKYYARKVDFGSVLGSIYLIAPVGDFDRGAILIYSDKAKLLSTVKPYGGFSKSGLNLSLDVDETSNNVYLAVATRKAGTTARLYQVAPSGLTFVQSLTAATKKQKGNILVAFLNLYSDTTGLATAVVGKSSTIKVWKLDQTTGKFAVDATSKSKIKLKGSTLTLK